ncbi:diguanylate cyclase domain-containing protein [Telluria sp. Tellsp104]
MNTVNLGSAVLLDIINVQTEIASQGLDLNGVTHLACRHAEALCKASGAIVELADDDDMVFRATCGIASAQLGLRLRRGGSLSGLCVDTGDTLICEDSETDPRVDRAACRKVGLRSMLVVPLRHEAQSIGVLKVVSSRVKAFKARHARILGLLSALVSAAIYHAVQHESNDLYYRATHDALTSLANRALFYDRLRQQIAHMSRQPSHVAIVNIDMDGLKAINDHLGHRAGDAAIREVASRIAGELRADDVAARVGGDEFGVILVGVRDRDSVESKCNGLRRAIDAPFAFEGKSVPLSASIGYALWPEDGEDMERLIDLADQAMYRVKRERRSSTVDPGR